MKKIISALQILVLCLSMSLSVCAAAPENGYVIDDLNYLTLDEMAELDELGADIYKERGIGVFYVFTTEDEPDDYDVTWLIDGVGDYYIMVENDDSWYTVCGGKGEEISLSKEELRAIYDEADTYVGGVRDFMQATAECFPVVEQAPVSDAPVVGAPGSDNMQVDVGNTDELVLDDAELLSDTEEAQLEEKLLAISKQYGAQIVVGTLPSAEGMDIDELLNFFYDEGGFGYGANRDGVFLLVCMDPREYRILSNGFAGDAIQDGEIESISNEIVSDLSDGNYADAFNTFADECAYYLDGHINGYPFNVGKSLLIALAVGVVASFIVSSVLKGQMKSVHKKNEADVYVKAGSMQITQSGDYFMYRNVTKTQKQSSSSSGSSGGSSRSTGGGSF